MIASEVSCPLSTVIAILIVTVHQFQEVFLWAGAKCCWKRKRYCIVFTAAAKVTLYSIVTLAAIIVWLNESWINTFSPFKVVKKTNKPFCKLSSRNTQYYSITAKSKESTHYILFSVVFYYVNVFRRLMGYAYTECNDS